MHEMAELELIAQSRGGDQGAIAELFRRHYTPCLRLARGVLRSEEDAQDAVQSAYVSAFRHFYDFRGDSTFRTWISRIVINCCMVQRRTPWRKVAWTYLDSLPQGRGADSLASHGPNPEKSAYSQEIHAALSLAVSRLPGNLRDAFTLYCVSGLSVKEVAATLGVSQAAAKTRVFRARARVRGHLQPVWSHRHAENYEFSASSGIGSGLRSGSSASLA
jgi:RNA polymerase sigma-70 factor (ECF subfamily)